MISDLNKGITDIEYNHLNLPTKITVTGTDAGTIDYVYDATGSKLQKTVSTGTITDYAGNYIYENGSLQFFNTSEGYVEPVFASGSAAISSFNYTYQYKDHLGNIRLSYTETTPTTEVDENYETNMGGWLINNPSNTTTSLENGTLKTTIIDRYHIIDRYIDTTPGEHRYGKAHIGCEGRG